MNRNNNSLIVNLLIVIALIFSFYLYKPVSVHEISTVEGFVQYASSFGPVMPLFVFVLTTTQAVFPAFPFIMLCIANGLLLGFSKGVLLTWAGSLLGASTAFYISRRFGYHWAAGRYGQTRLALVMQMTGYQGFLLILALRLLPCVPAPLINISAGISKINFGWFLLASALGKIPFIAGYTLLGYSLLRGKNLVLGGGITAGLIIISYLIAKRKKEIAALMGKGQ